MEIETNRLSSNHVTPGDILPGDETGIAGHGVVVINGTYISTLHGVVKQINKLVSVNPVRSRYTGDVGDVVVGRIVQVGSSGWRVDINGRNSATLQLSAINLPDGIQRRRTAVDELNIRSFFDVNELIWSLRDGSPAVPRSRRTPRGPCSSTRATRATASSATASS